MSEIEITQDQEGYRGEGGTTQIFVPSRSIRLPGKKRLFSRIWYLVGLYVALYFGVYAYIQAGGMDQLLGSMVLLAMMGPLIALVGGGVIRSSRGGRRRDIAVPTGVQFKPGSDAPRELQRPNQRLLLGAKSLRQVYEDESMSRRNVPLNIGPGTRLEVRDDDGEDDGVIETGALWLVHASGEEQVLLNNIARDERDEVTHAVREALARLT